MGIPFTPNVVVGIYRSNHLPPDPLDVANVAGYLQPAYERGRGEQATFTHVLLLDVAVDIRDGYSRGSYGDADRIVLPSSGGALYLVRFVERLGRDSAFDHKRVFLDRQLPTWPSVDL